ncbi:ABC transporter permease [Limnoglobus roseus]|uniref:ABC transporter permease n=2 Tax=Limnoglobus roseus TaxID=2598579 RepID=A0A5C1AM55_9BACT|nr:ABC transporter permease [Limnoglobus roseus]
MYKFLLCLKYLRTRYLAFVCIVSIMLGVATLIVVNSVMSGFSNKLKDRLKGVLADVIVETDNFAGFQMHPDLLADKIQHSPAGKYVDTVAPTVEVVGTVQFSFRGMNIVKPIKLTGVDPAKQVKVGGFGQYLERQKNVAVPSFDLSPEALAQHEKNVQLEALMTEPMPQPVRDEPDFLGKGPDLKADGIPLPPVPMPELPAIVPPKPIGIVVGHSLAHFRYKHPETGQMVEEATLRIGDTVMIATLAANEMRPVWGTYVVVDYFKSEMSEYDSQFIYMNLPDIQRLRHMDERVTHLQVKLKDDCPKGYTFVKGNVANEIQKLFGRYEGRAATWEDHQGPLLSAIDIERAILNLLLFMIVGVAGFSILAIFTMIVSEKIRDIGILKSLGASNRGVMGIFVWYAFLLGVVGCTAGTIAGLGITNNINEIEAFINTLTGQQLFDRSVYYFDRIPTNVEPATVLLVNTGAMLVAVFSSFLPAYRAARLRPIQALRFE